jgi:septum formation protein
MLSLGSSLKRAGSRVVLASASPRRAELIARIVPPECLVVLASQFEENLDKSVGPITYAVATATGKCRDVMAKIAETPPSPAYVSVLPAPFSTSSHMGIYIYMYIYHIHTHIQHTHKKKKKNLNSVASHIVIGSDTVVVSPDGAILEKPATAEVAAAMLAQLSGRTHRVVTGVAIGIISSSASSSSTADNASVVHTLSCSTTVRFAELSDADIAAYVATGEPMDKAGAYGIQGLAGVFVTGIDGCYYNVMGLPLHAVAAALRDNII